MKMSLLGLSKKTKNLTVSNIEIIDFLNKMKVDLSGNYISHYREIYSELIVSHASYVHYDRIPNVCAACEYGKNAKSELVMRKYNGVIALEVADLVNMVEIETVKRQAALLPQTLAAFAGCEGHSVVILALAALPNNELPVEQELCELFHAKAYQVAVKCYAPTLSYNIKIVQPRLDASFKMPLDPNPFANANAIPFIVEQPKSERELAKLIESDGTKILGRLEPDSTSIVTMHQLFGVCHRKALDEIRAMGWSREPIAEVTVIAKVCAKSGMPEEEVTSHLLWHYYKENPIVVRDAVRTVYNAEENIGHTSAMPKKQLVALQLREFIARRYDVRYNTVLGVTEYRQRQSLDFMFHELSKRDRNTIRHEAALEGIEAFDSEINGLLESNYVKRYNPIDEYIGGLGTWDGRDRISELASMVTCDNPNWQMLFKRWMLSLVAQWMGLNTEHGNNTLPILVGPQGYRKSTFCRIILPPELRSFYTDSIDFRTKVEAERMLGRFLLINIDEFDQLNDNQLAFVKHLTQKVDATSRRSYSNVIDHQRRYASYIATSNHQDVLRDPTGSRRYLCVNVLEPIRVETAIDYKQLYAQAVTLIQDGERYWYDDSDEALLKLANKNFEKEMDVEIVLLDIIRKPENKEKGEWVKLTSILQMVKSHPGYISKTMNDLRKLGRSLTKMQIDKNRRKDGWWYNVVKL